MLPRQRHNRLALRSAEPEYEVVPHIHAARESPVELTPSQGQKRACERNPVAGKRIVFFPAMKMLRPWHTNWNELIDDSLTLQKTREGSVNQEGDMRFRKALPQVPQKRDQDGEVPQAPILDHQDRVGKDSYIF